MPEVLGTGTEAPETEALSFAGSTISQIFGMVRMFANWLIHFVNQLYTWLAEHPDFALMGFANLYIMFLT